MSEPNVYQLLELDPDQPWNLATFERQLQAKRQEWSRRINVPGKQGSEARTNLSLIPVLQKIATDPEQLKLQAAAVRAARVATVAEKQEQLEEHLTLLQIKGYLLEAEFKRLVMDFKEIATEPEIKRRITTPIRPAAPAKPTRPALEPTKAQEIETKLKQLSKTDLYDFLGLGHSTANSLLWQKANELYAGVQKKATKTPTDTHISELSGHCLVIFKTDAERARYDETLRLLGYKSLLAKVEIMAREIKRLEPEQIDRLLREAKAMGLDPDEALEAIMNYAAEKKYTILSISPVQTVRELQRCGDCHHINDKNARRCTNCGKPLKILCPKCAKSEVASDEKACSQCGFPTGNAGWVNFLIGEAHQTRQQKDYKLAVQHLAEAKSAWPAGPTDGRATKIEQLIVNVNKALTEQKALVKQMDDTLATRKYFQAKNIILPKLKAAFAGGDASVQQYADKIERTIQQAETKLKEAVITTKPVGDEEKLRIYNAVLAICVDFDDGALLRKAKQAEEKLQQQQTNRAKLLKQLQAAIKEQHYYAARQCMADLKMMSETADLARMATSVEKAISEAETKLTSARSVLGSDAEKAVKLCYEALHSCRDADKAQQLLAQILPSPPAGLQATLRGDIVHLTWSASPNQAQNFVILKYIVVRKYCGRSGSAPDGEKLASVTDLVYDDHQLTIGEPAFYTVFAARDGVLSKTGVTVAKPVMRIQKVRNLTKAIDDQCVHLRWETPPTVHEVIVRRSEGEFPRTVNDGQAVPVRDPHQVIDTQVQNGKPYFYSVFCRFKAYDGTFSDTAPVQIEAIAQVPPAAITKLAMTAHGPINNRHIQLRWRAPARGEVVILYARHEDNLDLSQVIPQQALGNYGQVLPTKDNQCTCAIQQLGLHYFRVVVIDQGLAYMGERQEYFCLDDVGNVQAEDTGTAIKLRWEWPLDCREVSVEYSYSNWPGTATGDTVAVVVTKTQYAKQGCHPLDNLKRGDCYICVRTVVIHDEKKWLAKGESLGARVLLDRPNYLTLEYLIARSRHFLARPTFALHIHLRRGGGKLPTMVLVAKKGEPPTHKQDGMVVLRLEAQLLQDTTSLVVDLTAHSEQGIYGRLFLENDRLYEYVEMRHPDHHQLKLF